jgi:hypothetical protein
MVKRENVSLLFEHRIPQKGEQRRRKLKGGQKERFKNYYDQENERKKMRKTPKLEIVTEEEVKPYTISSDTLVIQSILYCHGAAKPDCWHNTPQPCQHRNLRAIGRVQRSSTTLIGSTSLPSIAYLMFSISASYNGKGISQGYGEIFEKLILNLCDN